VCSSDLMQVQGVQKFVAGFGQDIFHLPKNALHIFEARCPVLLFCNCSCSLFCCLKSTMYTTKILKSGDLLMVWNERFAVSFCRLWFLLRPFHYPPQFRHEKFSARYAHQNYLKQSLQTFPVSRWIFWMQV